MKFYIVENQKPVGPFEIRQLIERGIKGSDLVWAEGMNDWAPAESVTEIREALYSAPSGDSFSMESGTRSVPEPPCPPVQPNFPPIEPQYQQQASYNQAPQQPYYSNEIPPKTWLAESILVTILCCLPFGIVGIIKASNVSSLWQAGRIEEARAASASAKKWTLIGFFASLAVYFLYIVGIIIVALIDGGFDNL
ncbi:MAG: CD225/dispanin family protein [Lachnospiraceae bacterium]|nr:CD225/dispanin family protein [Lachnospiraceae bacterium]